MASSIALDKQLRDSDQDLDSRVRLTPLPRLVDVDEPEGLEPGGYPSSVHASAGTHPQSFTRRLGLPYVGLRAFTADDHDVFCGREGEVRTLMTMLRERHLVALLGAAHSGRTSLVEAGLVGGLRRRPGEHWQVARMHAEGELWSALGAALLRAADDVEEPLEPGIVRAVARSPQERARLVMACLDGSTDAVERAAQHVLSGDDAKLLLVVEGFEHVARDGGRLAQRFVRQLLRAAQPPRGNGRVYVVLVGSDDAVGSFSEFPGLASALTGNMLVLQPPTLEQLRSAIEGPLQVNGWKVSPALREQLLQDCSTRPHSLASLQHALSRSARLAAPTGVLDLTCYAAAGCPHDLDAHANERFEGHPEHTTPLSPRQREIAQALFTGLLTTSADRVGTRAARLSELAQATSVGVEDPDLAAVVQRFAAPSCGLLRVDGPDEPLGPDARLSLGHPELVSEWSRLRQWARVELERAQIYRALVREASDELGQRLASDTEQALTGLLFGERLAAALRWWTESAPTKSWARRHTEAPAERSDELYELVERFLERSRERERKAEDARRRSEASELAEARRRRRKRRLTLATAAVALIAGGALLYDATSDRDLARAAASTASKKYAAAASENRRLAAEEERLGASLEARERDIQSLGDQLDLLEFERDELIDTGASMQQALDALDERLRLIVRAHDAALLDAQSAREQLDAVRAELERARQHPGESPGAPPTLSPAPWRPAGKSP